MDNADIVPYCNWHLSVQYTQHVLHAAHGLAQVYCNNTS